jgi:hypothetical protein
MSTRHIWYIVQLPDGLTWICGKWSPSGSFSWTVPRYCPRSWRSIVPLPNSSWPWRAHMLRLNDFGHLSLALAVLFVFLFNFITACFFGSPQIARYADIFMNEIRFQRRATWMIQMKRFNMILSWAPMCGKMLRSAIHGSLGNINWRVQRKGSGESPE